MATDWATKMKETIQPHVPEPVLEIGMLQPSGTWGAFGAGQVSPIVGMFMRKRNNERSGGLAKDTWSGTKLAALAVTADRVHAFRVKSSGRSFKVQDKVGEWDRSDLRQRSSRSRSCVR